MFRIKCKVNRIFHPKNGQVSTNDFYIFSVDNVEVVEGDYGKLDFTKYGTLSVQGNLSECKEGQALDLSIEFKDSSVKFGTSYKISEQHLAFALESEEDLEAFLNSINITEKQVCSFLSEPSSMQWIKSGNIEMLTTINGVGDKTAKRIISKYNANKEMQVYFEKLFKLGFTNYTHRVKIINHYMALAKKYATNSEGELNKKKLDKEMERHFKSIVENPYQLTVIDGFGLKTVDEIATTYMSIAHDSKFRIEKFIEFILYEEGNKGRSYLPLFSTATCKVSFYTLLKKPLELIKQDGILKEIPIPVSLINEVLSEMQKNDKILICSKTNRIALKYFYELELEVAKELLRIHKNVSENFDVKDMELVVADMEREQGFKYSNEQKHGVFSLADPKNGVAVLTGAAGCVDKDTEFFTGTEWKKISDYKDGDKVLQYNEDGSAELVIPERYIKQPKEYLWQFETKYGVNQCLSDNHMVVYETSKGNLYKKPFSAVKEAHENTMCGFKSKFYTTFNYSGTGINLSNEEIRVMCAVICDGTFSDRYKTNPNICRVNIKKERKKKRLETLLDKANISYSKKESSAKGYNCYYFDSPVKSKEFDESWYNCTSEQLSIICDEILHWDGCTIGRTEFTTCSKKTADFIQFAFSSQGNRVSLSEDNRVGRDYVTGGKTYTRKSICYRLSISKRNMVGIGGFHPENPNKTKINKYKTKDGFEYCFTVPSSMLVLRREGKIFITGNCGKTTVSSAIHRIFDKYLIGQFCFSGKASQRIAETSGRDSSTIHMHLARANGEDGATEYDIYIIDEASMIHLELIRDLLKTVPNGAKVIIIGDSSQLQSLSTGNLLADIISSGRLPVSELTTVYRQGLESGILSASVEVRNRRQLCKKTDNVDIEYGNNKDLLIKVREYKEGLERIVLDQFIKYRNEADSILDVQILSPLRDRGELSVNKLNAMIQAHLSPYLSESFIESNKLKFHVGDKVINTKNNYKAKTEDDETTAVFNGSIGVVVDFVREEGEIIGLLIDFQSSGVVKYLKEDCIKLNLAYAITVHSSQGSEFKNIIYALSNDAYTLLNKEQIYTAITRGKKHGTVIAQSSALYLGIQTSELNSKLTFLSNMLKSIEL